MKGGEKYFMKKNVLIKGVLLLIAIVLLTMGFTGCGAIIPTTGTVYLVVSGTWYYDLYIDNIQQFTNVTPGTYVITSVPIGSHYFEAIDTWGWAYGHDSTTQYITAGINYVYLNP